MPNVAVCGPRYGNIRERLPQGACRTIRQIGVAFGLAACRQYLQRFDVVRRRRCALPTIHFGVLYPSTRRAGQARGGLTPPVTEESCVACSSQLLCVAVDPTGYVFTSVNPSGGRSAWTRSRVEHPVDQVGLIGAACPSQSLCLAFDDTGKLAVGLPTWSSVNREHTDQPR